MKISSVLSLGLPLVAPASGRTFRSKARDAEHELHRRVDGYPAHYIDMPIDHFPNSSTYAPHTNATFRERYFFDSTYYKPGGPVIFYIGGEVSAVERLSNLENGIVKILEQATNGLGVILETRFYGDSYPFENSTTDNLRFLTTEQVIGDIEYFARNAKFPGANVSSSINAPHSPWILYGGSWAGALTAWSLSEHGGPNGTLWGGIAASGTTHVALEYPQWYHPLQKYGPQDCIASVNAIIDKVDTIFDTKNATLIHKMKSVFGLETLVDGDFAQAIAWPMGGPFNYPLGTWQELLWDPQYADDHFWWFCNNLTNADAPESSVAVDYELAPYTHGERWTNLGNYASYFKKTYLPICDGAPVNSSACFSTQNASHWADVTNGATRSYLYTTCNEYGLYQVAPKYGPSLISRVLQVPYTQQWCTWAFPPGQYNRIPPTPNINATNKRGSFNVVQDRLAHIDGEQDVWLDLCYHSNLAPERNSLNLAEETKHPQLLITGGGHHWDSSGLDGLDGVPNEPQFIRAAHQWEIRTVRSWMKEWETSQSHKRWSA